MPLYDLILALPSIGALLLGSYVFWSNPREPVGRTFALLFLILAYTLGVEFMYLMSESDAMRGFWLSVGSFRILAAPALLYFALTLTRRHRLLKSHIFLLMLWGVAAILAVAQVPAISKYSLSASVPATSILGIIANGAVAMWAVSWTLLLLIATAILALQYRLGVGSPIAKRQSQTVMIAATILICVMVLGRVELLRDWRFGAVFIRWMTVFAFGLIGYAIWRYRSLMPTTGAASEVMLSTMSDALFVVSSDQKIISTNNTALKMLGRTHFEVVGSSIDSVLPDGIVKALFPATESGIVITASAFRDIETQLKSQSGRDLPVSLSASLIRDREGNVAGVTCICRDITERRVAEKEREQLIEQLQEALDHVKTMRGLIPICAWCKKILDDQGAWQRLEAYLENHSDAQFSHGICPECYETISKEKRF